MFEKEENGELNKHEPGHENGDLNKHKPGHENGGLNNHEPGHENGDLNKHEPGHENGYRTEDESGQENGYLTEERRSRSRFVVICILLTELCERMTYYSISANLVLFCTSKLGFTDPDATTVQYIFSGSCYIVPVVGGWIADTISGKFNAIYGSGLIYILGSFLLVCAAVDYKSWFGFDDDGLAYNLNMDGRSGYFLAGLFFVALGTGGIKANVGPYGADQAEDLGESAVQTFFQWFYFFINTGSFIAYSAVAYVQQNISFALGYLIPFISMILALVFLLIGRFRYKNTPTKGSLLSMAVKIVAEGCRRRGDTDSKSLLDNAKKSFGGSFADATVEGIKCLGRVIPVYLTIIIYWAIYSQMSSTFFLQSVRMDVRIGSLVTPAAALNLFNVIIILILIPLMDRVIYPSLARIGKHPTLLQRIGFGMILAAIAMGIAGVLEIYRKKNLSATGGFIQELGGKKYNSSTLSMFLQVPQFAFIGASEVFTSVTGLEFAYSEAPHFLKGLIMGLFLVTSGIGSYVSVAIQKIVEVATVSKPWFPDEINTGNTEYFFFLLGGLMLLDFVIFLGIAKCYRYRKASGDTPLDDIIEENGTHDNPTFVINSTNM